MLSLLLSCDVLKGEDVGVVGLNAAKACFSQDHEVKE